MNTADMLSIFRELVFCGESNTEGEVFHTFPGVPVSAGILQVFRPSTISQEGFTFTSAVNVWESGKLKPNGN